MSNANDTPTSTPLIFFLANLSTTIPGSHIIQDFFFCIAILICILHPFQFGMLFAGEDIVVRYFFDKSTMFGHTYTEVRLVKKKDGSETTSNSINLMSRHPKNP